MIVPVLLSAILLFHALPSVLAAEGDRCVTPNRENAFCLKVNSCGAIAKAIQTQTKEAIEFARKSQCGYSGTVPLVCCGSTGLPTPVTTSKSTSSEIYQHPLLPTSNDCGIEHSTDRIYHGEETGIRESPWAAMIGYIVHGENSIVFSCGGSLINRRYVMTAGHCIAPRDRTLTSVRLGEHNTATSKDCDKSEIDQQVCNPPAVDFGIESTIIHPGYISKGNRKVNDIALIRLNRNVNFEVHIVPICLPQVSSSPVVDTNLTVVGWGETEAVSDSHVKLKAKLRAVPLDECQDIYSAQASITDYQYCAGGICKNPTQCGDSCNGDSGGPSVRSIPRNPGLQWIQEGVTSFGPKTCGQDIPAVYTRVSRYVTWIVDNIKP